MVLAFNQLQGSDPGWILSASLSGEVKAKQPTESQNDAKEEWHPPVLIIDDDVSQRQTLTDILRLEGFDPTGCASGTSGLEQAQNGDFAVVILDLRLPDLYGTQVLEKIHLSEQNPRVIIHTAFGSYESAMDSVNLGAFAYVQKGADPEELVRHVHRAVRERIREDLQVSQRQYETVVEHGPQAIILLEVSDEDSLRITEANAQALQLFGRSREDHNGLEITRLCPPIQPGGSSSMQVFRKRIDQALSGELPVFEWVVLDATQKEVPCEVRLSRYPSQGRQVVIGSLADISERHAAEEALRTSEKRFRVLYDENPLMFLSLNREGNIVSINQFGAARLGYQSEKLVGSSMLEICPSEEHSALSEGIASCFESPTRLHRWEMNALHRNGDALWVRVTGRVVADSDYQDSLLLVCEDISELRHLTEELSFHATHDPLTGLINRREFERRLGASLAHAQSEKSTHALLYLDLDQFKIVNDSCGHEAGDELLRQLGTALQNEVRSGDSLARLGGDEFGVLLERCSIDDAVRIADTIRQSVENFRFVWSDQTFSVAVSIGIVGLTSETVSITELLSAADTACYAAKDKGRNQIHLHHEGDASLAKRRGDMQWVRRIQTAISEQRLSLYFQPIVPLRNVDPNHECFELLLRMQRQDGKLESAANFLPAAERYSVSNSLDRWVVNAALRWLENDSTVVDQLAMCCINLSGQSLGNDSFIDYLTASLDESSVPADKICFEITETAAICEMSKAIRFMTRLKARGCLFALDDFGSGLTSFGYLKNLPVDYLKIDGSFVKDILDDPLDLAVVRSINEIGQLMGKKTIAEFVESSSILKEVKNLGVDFAQGYAVGKPKPIVCHP
ncbi:MAG: EAL domain-containing protein [bacterium]|nr:EAL domain-containing protein [bacterium]